jgi:ketosteroid isomerase-like protein
MGQRVLEPAHRAKSQEDEFGERYAGWKIAHAQSVESLMEYYAFDAVIIRETGTQETWSDLQKLAFQVRQLGIFDDVSDLTTPRYETKGKRIVLRLSHRYGHSNKKYKPLAGRRVLTWEKRDGQWLIVRDEFPPNYVLTR